MTRFHPSRARRRGVALFLATLIALICSLAGITMLSVAVSHIKRTQSWHLRARARYLAEAALVLARERLWANPDYCGGAESLDTDGDQLGDTPVTITMLGCIPGNAPLYDRVQIQVTRQY